MNSTNIWFNKVKEMYQSTYKSYSLRILFHFRVDICLHLHTM